MPTLYERLRTLLPNALFAPPWTSAQIAHAEKELNIRFPAWLRDLYLHCGGIQPRENDPAYLLWYKGEGGLIKMNKFMRGLWDEHTVSDRKSSPEVDWDAIDIRKFLIIATDGVVDQAIRLSDEDTRIYNHDVRNPHDRSVLASDLFEFCAEQEAQDAEIRNELFRGREPYRRDPDSPTLCDVDRLMDRLQYDEFAEPNAFGIKIRPTWTVDRAISQRPGEHGQLHIFGGDGIEFRLVSRDGKLPFIVKLTHLKAQPTCTVASIDQMVDRVDRMSEERNRLYREFTPGAQKELPTIELSTALAIWTANAAPFDEELNHMAEILCRRDDRRLQEDNRLGA
jgi:hypothetical protein